MKRLIGTLVLIGVVCTVAGVGAHEKHKHGNAPAATPAVPRAEVKKVDLTGELIDPQCWFTHNGEGKGHAKCAVMCARGGQDLAFLDSATGRVHTLIAAGHGKNPNDGLYDHVGLPVRIRGTLYQRGANTGLLLESVVKAK